MIQKFVTCGCLVIFLISCTTNKYPVNKAIPFSAYEYNIVKHKRTTGGVVVSAHPLASKAGQYILQKGGNAVDAAIATQLALAVVYPGAGNIGGGGFMVAVMTDGKKIALDFREKAPLKASRNMYLDTSGNAISSQSIDGHLAAGVPGTIAGLFKSMKYARLNFEELIDPAIALAEDGFVITRAEAFSLNAARNSFLKNNHSIPVFVKDQAWKEGDTLKQQDLANTLKRIRKDKLNGFYGKETADLIVSEMQKGGGIITRKDLKQYRAIQRRPVQFNYKGYDVVTMPLPSSGGILLPQMLKMAETHKLGQFEFHDPLAVQLMVEIERRAYEDRAQYMGDPDYVKVPVDMLTSDSYLAVRMKDYVQGKAGKSIPMRISTDRESMETTHISIVDKEGNAVAVTTTLNGGYGSRTVVAGAGFLLNNEMDDFSVKPGVPNMYGALGSEANSIQPGKRMLSSMTPTIILKDGKPFIVVGTPGGTTIPTSVFQSIVNIIDFGLSPIDAVNKPKFHHQWFPDTIMLERDIPASLRESLQKMGYKTNAVAQIGRTELIVIHTDGTREAVADKRGDDAAE